MDALFERRRRRQGLSPDPGRGEIWPKHQARVIELLKSGGRMARPTNAIAAGRSRSCRSDAESGFALSDSDRRMSEALTALYGDGDDAPKKGRGGLGGSAPRVAKWLGDIREFFPAPVVQVIQKDAFERKGLRQMLIEAEFLATVEADVNLIADLVSLRGVMPDKTKETARIVIAKVVKELMERLERRTADAIRGALNRSQRTNRPRFSDIDWPRTIKANLRHYQAEHRTVVPGRLIGFLRQQRRIVNLEEVVLCVDQSGSMATSVVYASIFAAVMASLPVVATKLVCFDTAIVDLTESSPIPSRCCSVSSSAAAPTSTARSPIAKSGSSGRQSASDPDHRPL